MDLDSFRSFRGLDKDFGFGMLIFECFKNFVDLLSLLVLFYFSLKTLHENVARLGFFTRIVKYYWFCLRDRFDGNSTDPKTSSTYCKCGLVNVLNTSTTPTIEKWEVVKETICNGADFDQETGDKQEEYDENVVIDLTTLRRLVKMERQRANDAYLELEKERMSSTTAAEEAMAMILRLQNQKSVVELEVQQQRRLTHEKQLHDQEVIQCLRWIVMKHESERSMLEDRLRLYKQRLMLCMNDDGDNNNGCERGVNRSLSSRLDVLEEDHLVSSLDLGLSPC